ncbi:hypothetical protein ACLOJK_028891, partial [Asimina triloba]
LKRDLVRSRSVGPLLLASRNAGAKAGQEDEDDSEHDIISAVDGNAEEEALKAEEDEEESSVIPEISTLHYPCKMGLSPLMLQLL